MQAVEAALEVALQRKSSAAWDYVDELARQVLTQTLTAPEDVKRLISLLLRRKGYSAEDAEFQNGAWGDTLLARILETMERSKALRTQFSTLPGNIHSIDRSGSLIAVTDGWLRLLGYSSPNDVLGKKSIDFLSPSSREKAINVFLPEFWRKGVIQGCDYVMVRSDGKALNVLFDAVGVRDKKGDVVNSICSVREK